MGCRTWSPWAGAYTSPLCSAQLLPETGNPSKACSICVTPLPIGQTCDTYLGKVIKSGVWPTAILERTWTPLLKVTVNMPVADITYFQPWWRATNPLAGSYEVACHGAYNGEFIVTATNSNCAGWASYSDKTLYVSDCTTYDEPRFTASFPTSSAPGEYIFVNLWWRRGTETGRAIFRKYLPERLTGNCREIHAMEEWRHDDTYPLVYVPIPAGCSVSIGPV